MNREEIITILRHHYAYLVAEYGIKRIGLFGSFARDRVTQSSDVDLVIEFDRPIGFRFVELAEDLEKILGRKVDLLTPTSLRGIRIPSIAAEIEESIIYV